jgi:RNA polymerase sigma factor (sigma-70 family)
MTDENAPEAARRQAMVEDLYLRHGALVYRTCRRILADHHAAEDAAQEVFAKLSGHGDPTAVRDPRRWLLEVTRNHCIDRMRSDARRPTSPIATGRADAAEDAEARSLAREHVRWLLSLLTPRQRDVVVHQAVLDEPLDTVAARLGLSYGAAAQALYRARTVLARAGGSGDAALVLAGGRIAGLGRRLHALVLRLAGAGRLQAGRTPVEAALALPVAALLVSLLAGGQAAAHPQNAPAARSTIIQAGAVSAAARIGAPVRQPAAVAVVAHRPAVPAAAPRSAPVPTPPATKQVLHLSQDQCISVPGVVKCFKPRDATITVTLGPVP